MQYYTSDNDPDVKYCPFPRLDAQLKHLRKQYYEAEFEGNLELCELLKPQIKSKAIAIELGEEYDVPF